MKYIISIVAGLLLSACTITQPPLVEYKIAPEIPDRSYQAEGCKEQTLKVLQAFSANSLKLEGMRYREGEFMEHGFNESEWVESPNRAISQELLKSIRASNIFKNVQNYSSRGRSDRVLESSIEDFMQYFSANQKESYVRVVLALTLIDVKTMKIIKSKELSIERKAESADAKSGVEALNLALSDILKQNNSWLEEVCK